MTLSIIFEMAGHLNTSTMGFRLQTQCCSEPLFQSEAKCNRKGFALSLVLKVNVYGARQKLPIVDKSLVATVLASAGMGEGGVLLGILGGGVQPGSPNPDPISDQKMSFHTRFQTRPLKSIPVFRPCL